MHLRSVALPQILVFYVFIYYSLPEVGGYSFVIVMAIPDLQSRPDGGSLHGDQ